MTSIIKHIKIVIVLFVILSLILLSVFMLYLYKSDKTDNVYSLKLSVTSSVLKGVGVNGEYIVMLPFVYRKVFNHYEKIELDSFSEIQSIALEKYGEKSNQILDQSRVRVSDSAVIPLKSNIDSVYIFGGAVEPTRLDMYPCLFSTVLINTTLVQRPTSLFNRSCFRHSKFNITRAALRTILASVYSRDLTFPDLDIERNVRIILMCKVYSQGKISVDVFESRYIHLAIIISILRTMLSAGYVEFVN